MTARLAIEIDRILTQRKLTQRAATALRGIDQPKISQLTRGRLDGDSTERLLDFLTTLGRDIDTVVRPTPRSRRQRRLTVIAASAPAASASLLSFQERLAVVCI